MYTMQNRKMPSPFSVRIYLISSLVLAILAGLMPFAFLFSMLALCFSSVALLSIPQITYSRVLLLLAAEALVASGIVLLLTRNPACCFAAASFAPAAALLILTIRRHSSRTCGILLGSLGMGLFYLACLITAIYITYNRLSATLFRELYASLETKFVDYITTQLNSDLLAQIDADALPALFRSTVLLLPALCCDLIFFIVWLATVCLRIIFRGYLYGAHRFADWKVTMNRPSAWVFCIGTLLIGLTLLESTGSLFAVFINILLLLLPGFFCVGCRFWKERFFSPNRKFSFSIALILLLLLIFGLRFSPLYPAYLIAFSGALRVIFPIFPRPNIKKN